MRSARTGRLARSDKKNIWHPFTQMKEWDPHDFLVIEKAKGNFLIDTDGNRYLDGVSSLWCNVHGHRVPEIDRAVTAQLKKIAHSTFLGLSNVPAVELAEKLVRIHDGIMDRAKSHYLADDARAKVLKSQGRNEDARRLYEGLILSMGDGAVEELADYGKIARAALESLK